MKMRISKHYGSDNRHDGWKKTIGGKEWFLGYGVGPSDEAKARKLAEGLQAKWQLAKFAGAAELTQTDFDEVRDLVAGHVPHISHMSAVAAAAPQQRSLAALRAPVPTMINFAATESKTSPTRSQYDPSFAGPRATSIEAAPTGAPRRWLYEAIDALCDHRRRQIKSDDSNCDHMLNICERIVRAKDGIEDIPLDLFRRKELDDWLAHFGSRPPTRTTGEPMAATTVRNVAQAIRVLLNHCIEWEWWTPPVMWESAFKPYTVKKLMTREEKCARRVRPVTHTPAEKRVLWHLCLPSTRALMALADWAGHTQMEIATLHFDDFKEINGEMFIERFRNKTGVQGRWWIPPEPAEAIREVTDQTPRDLVKNAHGLAFLTPQNNPLVFRSATARKVRCDYVKSVWETAGRHAVHYGVRKICFKMMRKGTAQMVRDRTNMEMSKVFCAHAFEDVQDMHYTRPSFDRLEQCMREIYADVKRIYEPIEPERWRDAIQEVYESYGKPAPEKQSEE